MNSNILVTGGSGLVGKHLQEIMPDAIYLSSKDCDLTKIHQVDKLFAKYKPRVVIHLAARVGGIMDNLKFPVDYLEQNILMTTNVLMNSHKYNVERVYGILSTCIYPDIVESYPLQENQLFDGPPPPSNFSYAMSKRATAVHIDSYVRQYNKKWCYLIPCNLYGEFDKFEEHNSHYVAALIKKLFAAKDKLEIWGTGKPLRQFMYAKDFARVIKYLLEKDIVENFNVAPDYVHTIEEIAKIGMKACGKYDLEIVFDTEKPDGQFRKDVDSSKLLKVLQDFKFTSLEVGIEKVYDNFSKRHNRSRRHRQAD